MSSRSDRVDTKHARVLTKRCELIAMARGEQRLQSCNGAGIETRHHKRACGLLEPARGLREESVELRDSRRDDPFATTPRVCEIEHLVTIPAISNRTTQQRCEQQRAVTC